ncbi:hypothetical protein ACGFYV_05270 [Streptomyces sp. NPDC048297]|uniref:hypothetical protein n=1 Tax=Streptomyces sp. NPDC048297 TaxID=3365531 RepID=UPI003715ECF4
MLTSVIANISNSVGREGGSRRRLDGQAVPRPARRPAGVRHVIGVAPDARLSEDDNDESEKNNDESEKGSAGIDTPGDQIS